MITNHQGERNGDAPRVVWWLLGLFSAISIALLGAWGKGVNNDINSLKEIVYQIPQMAQRLERIENKQDEILNQEKPKHATAH